MKSVLILLLITGCSDRILLDSEKMRETHVACAAHDLAGGYDRYLNQYVCVDKDGNSYKVPKP